MKMAIYQNLIGCNLDYDFFFFFPLERKTTMQDKSHSLYRTLVTRKRPGKDKAKNIRIHSSVILRKKAGLICHHRQCIFEKFQILSC